MSDEIIEPPSVSDNSLAPALRNVGKKTRVKFDWDCLKQDKITFTHGKIVNIYVVYEIRTLKCKFWRLLSSQVKIRQIPYVNFETTGQFFFRFLSFFSVIAYNSSISL